MPNLSLSKSAIQKDRNVTFTVSVTNDGTGSASNLVVTDCLKKNFKITGASGTGWSVGRSGNKVTAKLASLAAGVTASPITINAVLQCVNGQTSNAACVTSSTPDQEPCSISCSAICNGMKCPVSCNKCDTVTIKGRPALSKTAGTLSKETAVLPHVIHYKKKQLKNRPVVSRVAHN